MCTCTIHEEVLAKDTGETLIQHTENCLKVFAHILEIYPEVPELCGVDDFFQHLFYAIFLHDFGKAAEGFQKYIRNTSLKYGYRHEMLSAGFVSCLEIDESYKKAICLAIITHHKDLKEISDCYSRIDETGLTRNALYKEKMRDLIPHARYIEGMFSLMPEYSRRYLGKELDSFRTVNPDDTIDGFRFAAVEYLDDAAEEEYSIVHGTYGLFLKGFLTACDHLSSASKYEIKNAVGDLMDIYNYKNYTSVQLSAMNHKGHAMIISPTGSGKTEASLFWADANQNGRKNKRVYYVLPYTASINAMYKRLKRDFEAFAHGEELVGVLHGKADYFIYRSLAEDGETADYEELREKSRAIQSLSEKIFRPYKILTPFQIIKSFFGVKGFEQHISEMVGGLFILDEIHAYNPRTTALILETLKILKDTYKAKILIMSATIPQFLMDMFASILEIGRENCIRMKDDELEKYTRHRVILLEGQIVDRLDLIRNDIRSGKKVLVVCNTVSRAQEVYKELKNEAPSSLLHGRFILQDRERIEKGLGESDLLVGTQAIEVSLDIDYDVLYTEPAPIDALLQRFGRVNRRVHKGLGGEICPVYIFREGSAKDSFIYDINITQRTIGALDRVDLLRECLAQELVDHVYKRGYSEKQKKVFNSVREAFQGFYRTVVPFINNEEVEDKFYRLFDSYTVVPIRHMDNYKDELEEKRYFEAMGYTLGISTGQFFKLLNDNKIHRDGSTYFINCEYDPELGLKLDEYPSNMI